MNEKRLKRISEGKSRLSSIIGGNYLYVDKTVYILKILNLPSSYIFLSRPRRFGKTLLVDTFENVFKGNKDLFKDLFIYDKWGFDPFPVLRLSLNSFSFDKEDNFRNNLDAYMRDIAADCGIDDLTLFDKERPESYLTGLIRALYMKHQEKVVILIDEYDYPLTDAPSDLADYVTRYLSNFYMPLKIYEEYIQFCFITGIVRFTNLSIFSKLNNLKDISEMEDMAGLCGYTEEEFNTYFTPYVHSYLKDKEMPQEEIVRKIKSYYDGYAFSPDCGVRVFNPVSIAAFFNNDLKFDNYWVSSGSVSNLNSIVSSHIDFFIDEKNFVISRTSAKIFEAVAFKKSNVQPSAVYSYMLQAGYLTIDSVDDSGNLVLRYPNEEVASTVNAFLLRTKLHAGDSLSEQMVLRIKESLYTENIDLLFRQYRNLFASIPHQANRNVNEGTFESVFLSTLRIIGFDVKGEESVSSGDCDMTVAVSNRLVYVFEFKVNETAETALQQIKDKKYYAKYMKEDARIHLIGVQFSKKERNIVEWAEDLILV